MYQHLTRSDSLPGASYLVAPVPVRLDVDGT